MGHLEWPSRRKIWHFILSASTCLTSGTALAQQVVGYVTVQPITVCSGTVCAPFNTMNRTGKLLTSTGAIDPKNQDQKTNPIGFVDPSSPAINYARAVLSRIGIDVTFLPILPYTAKKPDGTTYLTLNVVQNNTQCGLSGNLAPGAFQSCDFLTLSQQPQISQSKLINPPNGWSYTPQAPLSQNPTVINMFFVNKLNPPVPGQLYGFAWRGNNGVAIASTVFFPVSPNVPRPDTLPHELTHSLGLDHMDMFNPNTPPADLMTSGDTRSEPTVSGTPATVPLTPPNSTYDQLTESSPQETAPPQTPMSQLGEILTSGFVSAVPFTQTTAGATGGGGGAAIATASTSSAAGSNAQKNSDSIFFDLQGPFTPSAFGQRTDKSLAAMLIELPKQLQLDPKNPYQSVLQCNQSQCAQDLQLVKDTAVLQGNNGNLRDICAPAENCFLLDFNPGFVDPDFLEFSIGIRSRDAPITIDQLAAGGKVTYVFRDGYQTTSALKACEFDPQLVCASPQTPDLTVASQIVDPNTFQGSGRSVACTPIGGTGPCPDVAQTGVSDADPTREGGQLSP